MPAPLALPAAAPETSRWDFLRLFQALGYSFQKNRDGAAAEKLAQKRPQDVRAALLLGHARKRRGGKDMPRSLAYFLPIVAEVETDNPEGVDQGYLEYLERWVSDWEPFFRYRDQEPSEALALAS
jgi:predicted component of type VI protein secretion system